MFFFLFNFRYSINRVLPLSKTQLLNTSFSVVEPLDNLNLIKHLNFKVSLAPESPKFNFKLIPLFEELSLPFCVFVLNMASSSA